jgi:DNA modification methylase
MNKKVMAQKVAERYAMYHADCVALATDLPDNSIDFTVYSPPYSNLYLYNDSEADMGNTDNDGHFFDQYRFLIREKYRVTRPGRLSAVHVKDLVYYQGSSEDGSSGIRPFSDEVIRLHLDEGWKLQCRITIWRDPVLERSKTNAHGLLYKSFRGNASICRVGMPEYLLVFRKWPRDEIEKAMEVPIVHPQSEFPLPVWQELASPVWPAASAVWNYTGAIKIDHAADGPYAVTQGGQSGGGDGDLRATDVLNVRQARDPDAEKHLCPMPLNISARAIALWSNSNEIVWSPFAGIGSEGVSAITQGRRFIGSELNPAYYRAALGHLGAAADDGRQLSIFDVVAT